MLVFLIIFVVTAYFLYSHFYSKRKNLPLGPTPLPIVGNILQMDVMTMHQDFLKWKKEYGNIFTVWLPDPYVIVNDYEVKIKKLGPDPTQSCFLVYL